MLNLYTREKIENWASDFCQSDRADSIPGALRDIAPQALVEFLVAACERRQIEPDEIEVSDLKAALLERVAKLALPPDGRAATPELCAAFLESLQEEGRLGGGRSLAAYVRALRPAFEEAAGGKPKPIVNPGSKIGRNDPCPCGSGKKYKKCCMNE
ncbi:MAG: SEC-C metal-binding domain-containing protein [Phycisphaerae bacterium]